MQGRTMLDLGRRNELTVLSAVRLSPDGTSQSEVVHRTGLSRQAVSLITRRLRERGLIETDGTLSGSRGKPRTVLRIVPTALLAAGVHLDPAGISLVIVDLLAEAVAQRSLAPPTDDPPGDIARIARELSAMQEDLQREGWRTPDGRCAAEAMLGIGVASPGGVDVAAGIVLTPPWLPGWRHVPVTALLEHETGLPVVLDKDTNAALTAETWSVAGPAEESVQYVYLGAGVGSALSIRGRPHHGAAAQAGEIGHLPTGLTGRRCGCGRDGCLSVYTDVETMLSAAEARGLPLGGAGRASSERLAHLVASATAGDPVAAELVGDYGAALGEALRTLIDLHDPHRLVIGGPSWDVLSPLVLPEVQRRAAVPAPDGTAPGLESSRLGDGVGALGAATLFLQRELSPSDS
ncbi:ROK family transcriptional regulator [Brachybacterium saurashtrense]|uniref:ROK family transcriptional regulator n=1 Tax=Brachybacterium saurashtrense TaxID=556288 RepID=A0A345YS94_9MICO|nr:ROK family transcriptional regulator [Brachybacterium saurashtrense]AXK46796.1 ROK family transcriptional regulator [Brachybacterium saurashtrense]RRR22511.1 ROK family transcriptional regulator [Brachybacterium saurashtrense]